MRYSILLILFFIPFTFFAQDLCTPIEEWEKYFVAESFIDCDDWDTKFFDDFTTEGFIDPDKWITYWPCDDDSDNCPGSRLEDLATMASYVIRRDENVVVEEGVAKLKTTKVEGPNTWHGIQRDFNGGYLQGANDHGYNFGKFEIDMKAPKWSDYWEAIWFWNQDEIDLVEFANPNGYRTNVYPSGLGEECDEWEFATYGNGTAHNTWHNYKMIWSPYKISFYLDHNDNYWNIYRYYDLNGNPMDIECGQTFPEGVYRINPKFPKQYGRWFRFRLSNKVHWDVVTERAFFEPPTFIPANAIMEVDNAKIEQRNIKACGGIQYELPDEMNECITTQTCFRIKPIGDNKRKVNITSFNNSSNIEAWAEDLSSPSKGKICFNRSDTNPGTIGIEYLDDCDVTQNLDITIPGLIFYSDCNCDLIITEDFTLNEVQWPHFNKITVENGATLTIENANISFLDGIYVHENSSLAIRNSYIHPCTDRWQGIFADNKANSIELYNSLIEYAKIGVRLGNIPLGDPVQIDFSIPHNPNLICDNSIIDNCDIGIQFGVGYSNSEIRGNSIISENNIGIKYGNHTGLTIDDTNFSNNNEGILNLDGYMHVRGGNLFDNNNEGISINGTLPGVAGIDIGDMDFIHNSFVSNQYDINCVGSEHPAAAIIRNCQFDNSELASVLVTGSQYRFYNNTVNNTPVGLSPSSTGDNFNYSNCNIFSNIAEYSNFYSYENSGSRILENTFSGSGLSNSINIAFLDATIIDDLGTSDNPAGNCFHTNGRDFYTEWGVNSFNYHYYADTNGPGCQEPKYNSDFSKIYSPNIPNNCDGNIGIFQLIEPGGNGKPTYSNDKDAFSKHISINAVITAIENQIQLVINSGGDDPRTLVIENESSNSEFNTENEILDQWIRYAMYRGITERNFEFVEELLLPLKKLRWQKRLFGIYAMQGKYALANQLLGNLPETNIDEINFKTIQRINIRRIVNGVKSVSDSDITNIEELAYSHVPSSAYARGLYKVLTGITLPYDFPDLPNDTEQFRRAAENTNDLIIRPNPATTYINLSIRNTSISQIEVFNCQGKIIYQGKNNSRFDISLENYTSGIYFAKASDENGKIYIQKFVVH